MGTTGLGQPTSRTHLGAATSLWGVSHGAHPTPVHPHGAHPTPMHPHGSSSLQSLREAIAEHRPLVGKLQRVSAQLVELSPEQGAPFQRRWQEVEEQYGHIRERVRQAAALLEDALPRYSQVRGWHCGGARPQGPTLE